MERLRGHVGEDLAAGSSSTRSRPVAVTSPMTVARTSHCSQMASTSSRSSGLDDGEHPLLGLARHHLERLHPRLAAGHLGHVDVHAEPAFAAVSLVAHVRPAPPRSWMPTARPASSSLRHASISRFSSNGSPTWTLGRLAASASSSPKPADARTDTPPMPSRPGRRAEQHREVATPDAWPSTSRSTGSSAEAQHVDQRVVAVGLVEHDLAADGRHTDGVAVTRDARHDAFGDPPAAGVVERAEAERVHDRDRSGPHGEDVAEDAADAGGRALVGLDGRRVVVALDAEGGGDAVADVDDAGVLARSDEDPALGGQRRRWIRDDL